MELSDCEFYGGQYVRKGRDDGETTDWQESCELMKELDLRFADNLLDSIVWPETTDSGYFDNAFQDIPLVPKEEVQEEPVPLVVNHQTEKSSLNTNASGWDQGVIVHKDKVITSTTLGLSPWEPPEYYEIPTFDSTMTKDNQQDPSVHQSDLLSYYSLLSGDMNSSQVSFGLDMNDMKPSSYSFESNSMRSKHDELKFAKKKKKDTHVPYDIKKVVIPRSRRGRQSKDEDLARQYSLPVSANELCMMSHVDLQNLLKREDLDEDQKEMMKKLRRRGRNKIAARRCRAKRMTGNGMVSGEEGCEAEDDDLMDDFEDEEEAFEEPVVLQRIDESLHGRKRKPTVKLSY
ncbi:unnamed protein product [Bursaphelenchus okinawaensis]|uniref:BZIP domain-containing protein n=1 Tax=Bursaphelenchus okinawaensis TaxID=465554 RepID=A0A811KIY7_9BILA|nr:unnamed protein product [Bursaphelenchus okinawaensis]CAG9104164.1 unnamed protein product [Bursaphelenchus okinawaensis]